ncbi:MAG: DUF3596 domain-containing protein [Rhodoferax sp.]|uniref:Arm DNA-binding domain-containing protein n=1 Tax=Rhodoferax sp. TaxID=50421 RepID=UPI0030169C9E
MGSIRVRPETGSLFMDFKYYGKRLREQTTMADTTANRKRLQKVLDRVETEITAGTFDYEKTFGKAPPLANKVEPKEDVQTVATKKLLPNGTPFFQEFADLWFTETEVSWRRSYRITQRGGIDKYLTPFFGLKEVGQITKADVLAFRASLAKVTTRKSQNTLSNRRINAVMKPLRQILNEAADRFEFTSVFTNIKPLKMKRSDVQPFSIAEARQIIATARPDYRNYFVVRILTGNYAAQRAYRSSLPQQHERSLTYVAALLLPCGMFYHQHPAFKQRGQNFTQSRAYWRMESSRLLSPALRELRWRNSAIADILATVLGFDCGDDCDPQQVARIGTAAYLPNEWVTTLWSRA